MKSHNIFTFSAVITKETEGYSGLCIDVDVASEGGSIEETKGNLIEAVNLYVETAIENNLPVLRPVPPAENPILTRPADVSETFTVKVDLRIKVYA